MKAPLVTDPSAKPGGAPSSTPVVNPSAIRAGGIAMLNPAVVPSQIAPSPSQVQPVVAKAGNNQSPVKVIVLHPSETHANEIAPFKIEEEKMRQKMEAMEKERKAAMDAERQRLEALREKERQEIHKMQLEREARERLRHEEKARRKADEEKKQMMMAAQAAIQLKEAAEKRRAERDKPWAQPPVQVARPQSKQQAGLRPNILDNNSLFQKGVADGKIGLDGKRITKAKQDENILVDKIRQEHETIEHGRKNREGNVAKNIAMKRPGESLKFEYVIFYLGTNLDYDYPDNSDSDSSADEVKVKGRLKSNHTLAVQQPLIIRPSSAPSELMEKNVCQLKRQETDSNAPSDEVSSPALSSAEAITFIKRGNRPQISPIVAFELPNSAFDEPAIEDSNQKYKTKKGGKIHGKVRSFSISFILILMTVS